jgi:hypothetical protein
MPSGRQAQHKLDASPVHMSIHKKTMEEADPAPPGDNIGLPLPIHRLSTPPHGFVRTQEGRGVAIKPLKLRIFLSLVARRKGPC